MKKRTRILLTAILCASAVTACGSKEVTPAETTVSTTAVETTATTATEETTVAETTTAEVKPEDSVLGIGRSNFWPFITPEFREKLSPFGIDELAFTILAENVEPGTGALEIRKSSDDKVVVSIPVEEITFENSVYEYEDGTSEPCTYLNVKVDPIVEQGELYLHIPEGAFTANGLTSKEVTGKDMLGTEVGDFGYPPSDYKTTLHEGESSSYDIVLGSVDHIEIEVDGTAVTVNVDELEEDGTITATYAEPGKATVRTVFYDAQGNMISRGDIHYTCE